MNGTHVPVECRKWVIPAMLFFGMCTTLTQKFMIEQKVQGRSSRHKFNKPWFLTLIMFIGMLLALVIYEILNVRHRRLHPTYEPEVPRSSRIRAYCLIAVPAMCDLLATGIMNTGLLYIRASAWQMLRGSMTVFSSLLHAFVLKRKYTPFMWAGVFIVTLAIVVVGLATAFDKGVAVDGSSEGQITLAIVLTIGSQFIRACEIVLEDYLLHDKGMSAFLIVGVKGFWGTLITGLVVLPLAQFVFSGVEGGGLHEDTRDTFEMLRNDYVLIAFAVLYILFILGLNTMAMLVTNITNAVMRTITESLRTLCVWVAQLILYDAIRDREYGHHHPTLGESWSDWNWMQLGGFGLLITGMLSYNSTVKLPGFAYPPRGRKPYDRIRKSGGPVEPLGTRTKAHRRGGMEPINKYQSRAQS
jgi:drug/metabolite transporter (DMT)-like permease